MPSSADASGAASSRFDVLERRARTALRNPAQWVDTMNALRAEAARPEADPHQRLRFASRWLRATRPGEGPTENDRLAYLWTLQAAHHDDPDAAVLLGHCYLQGRGARRSLSRARRWYRRGAAIGSEEAAYWADATPDRFARFLLYRGRAFEWVGLSLLAAYFVLAPWVFSASALVAYLAIAFGGQLLVRWALQRLAPASANDDRSAGNDVVEGLTHKPWHTLGVAGEDGLVLVPLLALAHVLGVSWWVAPVAGLLFGALHFPNFAWRGSLAKGLTYGLATAVILPWGGVAAMALGHVLLDGAIVALALLDRSRARRHAEV